MKEAYSRGIANHTDPESCEAVRKGSLEALTRARTGPVLNREIIIHWGADLVRRRGRPYRQSRQRERQVGPTRSETRRMYGNSLRENREIPCLPPRRLAGRVRKSK